jgi:hypothetical protein
VFSPEFVELSPKSLYCCEVDPVKAAWPIMPYIDQTGLAEYSKVLAGRRLAHTGELSEFTGLQFSAHDQFQHPASPGVRHSLQSNLHIHLLF